MKYLNINIKIYGWLVLLLLITTQACKKTVYEQLLKPYNNIERFSIIGYGELDSVSAVIKGDSILVYWNVDVARPSTIKPNINVSTGATISPASGKEVNFSESTKYKVTAEDGTERTYTLKPVINDIVPLFTTLNIGDTQFDFNGMNFLIAPDKDRSAFKAYAKRLSDGYEFDLDLDTINMTDIYARAVRPAFTVEQDTGWHRIYVKFGKNLPYISTDGWVAPVFSGAPSSVSAILTSNGPKYPGNTISFKAELTGSPLKYIGKDLVPAYVIVRFADPADPNTILSANIYAQKGVAATNLAIKDGVISLTIPTTVSTALYGKFIHSAFVVHYYKRTSSAYNGSVTLTYNIADQTNVLTPNP